VVLPSRTWQQALAYHVARCVTLRLVQGVSLATNENNSRLVDLVRGKTLNTRRPSVLYPSYRSW
jgi:hypothetical protein